MSRLVDPSTAHGRTQSLNLRSAHTNSDKLVTSAVSVLDLGEPGSSDRTRSWHFLSLTLRNRSPSFHLTPPGLGPETERSREKPFAISSKCSRHSTIVKMELVYSCALCATGNKVNEQSLWFAARIPSQFINPTPSHPLTRCGERGFITRGHSPGSEFPGETPGWAEWGWLTQYGNVT
ncbi:hypothetical protein GcC1_182048 [Golovinomyces cichoracearum]|uniref:Uncharacterized protein n=1 Tax=Golovinomyces cichoracearum TaxID=62708 RepID=A0A420HMA3_9PEZI|nr:hypothetical protein GcC1_182048 [Golovinomyces cichoracearum]